MSLMELMLLLPLLFPLGAFIVMRRKGGSGPGGGADDGLLISDIDEYFLMIDGTHFLRID